MKRFREFRESSHQIDEGFKNFVGVSSIEDRRIWAERVWNMLQKTYSAIGGIKGSGFNTMEEMIQKIPFWKIFVRGEKLLVVSLYKDKEGRKGVAVGTNDTPEAKKILIDILKKDLNVSWGEQSKALLNFVIKNVGIKVIEPFLLTVDEVRKIMSSKEIMTITPDILERLGPEDLKIYRRYQTELGKYMYVRKIGEKPFLKVALGTPHKTIS
jgi:hypothetical protein